MNILAKNLSRFVIFALPSLASCKVVDYYYQIPVKDPDGKAVVVHADAVLFIEEIDGIKWDTLRYKVYDQQGQSYTGFSGGSPKRIYIPSGSHEIAVSFYSGNQISHGNQIIKFSAVPGDYVHLCGRTVGYLVRTWNSTACVRRQPVFEASFWLAFGNACPDDCWLTH